MNVKTLLIFVFTIYLLFLSSCFTGIESTKRIEIGREDKKQIQQSPEEQLFVSIVGIPLKDWHKGKEFLSTDNRLSLLMKSNLKSNSINTAGKILRYIETFSQTAPDGSSQAVISFALTGDTLLTYSTGKEISDALENLSSSQLPMLTDISMVEKADSILKGKKLYTLSPLWYDRNNEKIQGRRFIQVQVDSVTPSISHFPIKVWFSVTDPLADCQVKSAAVFLNFGNTGFDSRSLPSMFSLTDIKARYPSISSENWEHICKGEVALGMSKNECKLALGNPSDVNSGHDYSSTLDVWQYPDGMFLRFADGILVDFR